MTKHHPPGAGALFGTRGKGGFMAVTGSRYDSMVTRCKKKKLPPLTFTKAEFRAHVLHALGGHEDGALQCRFCWKWCTIKEVTPDHERPLSRGGDTGLHNLGFPCQNCNQAKGSLTPEEFLKLRAFLEDEIPEGRIDVLGRLAKANKLAAGAARNRMLLAKYGESRKPKQESEEPF